MNDRQLAVTTTSIESMSAGPPSRQPRLPQNAAAMKVPLRPGITGHNASGRPFEPATVRYIKLGQNGKWATDALEEGIIPFGYSAVDHHACLAGEWDRVGDQLVAMGRTANGVSQGLRELKDFYDLPDDTLWVTMANGHFWWAFAEGPVVVVAPGNPDKPARYRRTRAGWSKTSLAGEPLAVRSLSSALTRTASYQMTICTIKQADYLLRRIRGEPDPLHAQATAIRGEMRDIGLRMVRQLDWRDFETLVDLIFARGGWQRSSALGKHQPDVDLILTQPTTNETAWVQIKSKTDQGELSNYLDRFRWDDSCDRFFFVCHSAAGPLNLPAEPGLHLWMGERLADAAIDAGLFDWLVARTA
jgi:hypothetical protein